MLYLYLFRWCRVLWSSRGYQGESNYSDTRCTVDIMQYTDTCDMFAVLRCCRDQCMIIALQDSTVTWCAIHESSTTSRLY